jgi:signal transduction histidine kinase
VLGDPTAVVRYQRADGRWIGSAGGVLDATAADRRLLPVVDEMSNVVAGLEVDAATPVPPLLVDLAVSTIAAQSANERAAALADARRMEVRGRSRELVAAADAGRIALERNLHDGAQQLLVGLALTAGLQARQERKLLEDSTDRPSPAAAGLITHINQVRSDILELIDSGTPAALSAGLAGALRSLAVISPINASFTPDGDLPADDPLATGLYLAASEALTNAVKHSGATRITIVLAVDAETVRIGMRDNGIGGLRQVPHSLASRVDGFQGGVQVNELVGQGTTVTITAGRAIGGGR